MVVCTAQSMLFMWEKDQGPFSEVSDSFLFGILDQRLMLFQQSSVLEVWRHKSRSDGHTYKDLALDDMQAWS